MEKIKNNTIISEILSYIFITLGVIISSYALDAILLPNTILDGGVTGISNIISKTPIITISTSLLNIKIVLRKNKMPNIKYI